MNIQSKYGIIKLYCLVLLMLGLGGSCNSSVGPKTNSPVQFKKTYPEVVQKTSSFRNDSILMSVIYSISEANGLLFLNDFKQNRIFVVDTNFQYRYEFGTQGAGPGEWNTSLNSGVQHDTLWVYDAGAREFDLFSLDGQHLGIIKHPTASLVEGDINMQNGLITLSVGNHEQPLLSFDVNGKVIKRFGKLYFDTPAPTQRARNIRNVNRYQDKFIVLGRSEPILEKYELSGELIQKVNFHDHPHLAYTVEENQKEIAKMANPTSTILTLFNETVVVGPYLYALSVVKDGKYENSGMDQILVFDLNSPESNLIHVYDLTPQAEKRSFFSSFCILDQGKTLIAYNLSDHSLIKYRLEELP